MIAPVIILGLYLVALGFGLAARREEKNEPLPTSGWRSSL